MFESSFQKRYVSCKRQSIDSAKSDHAKSPLFPYPHFPDPLKLTWHNICYFFHSKTYIHNVSWLLQSKTSRSCNRNKIWVEKFSQNHPSLQTFAHEITKFSSAKIFFIEFVSVAPISMLRCQKLWTTQQKQYYDRFQTILGWSSMVYRVV